MHIKTAKNCMPRWQRRITTIMQARIRSTRIASVSDYHTSQSHVWQSTFLPKSMLPIGGKWEPVFDPEQ